MSGHIVDRWMIPDPTQPGRKVKGPRWGKGQRWAVRWAEGGRERQQAAPSKAAAEDVLRRVQAALATGQAPAVGNAAITARAGTPTAGHYIRQWAAVTGDTPGSRKDAQGVARRHLTPRWGDVPVDEIRPADLREWLAALERTEVVQTMRNGRVRRTGRTLGLSRRRSIAIAFRTVLDLAVEDDVIPANPLRRVTLPAVPSARGRSLEIDELRRLLAALEDESDQAGIMGHLLSLCALRTGEAVGLDVSEYRGQPGRRRLVIDDQVTTVAGHRHRVAPKMGRRREVPVPGMVEAKLDAYLAGRKSGPLIQPERGGDRYPAATWRTQWLRALAVADIPGRVRPHDLRHTGASLLILAGEDIKVVQAIMGHAKASTTLNIYGHLIDTDARIDAAAGRVDRLMSGLDARRGLRAV